jgi:hypothetical protein
MKDLGKLLRSMTNFLRILSFLSGSISMEGQKMPLS